MKNNKELKQAQQLHQQGDLVGALAIYQQLLVENPSDADIIHQIGIIFAQQQNYPQALQYLNEAIQIQPRSAPFYNSKGNVLIRQGQIESALSEYRKAIKNDPYYPIAYNNLGRGLYLQEKYIAAKKSYAKAIELNPNFSDALYNQGVLLLKLGELDAAKSSLQKSLSQHANNPLIFGQMAQIYLQEGDYLQAIDYLQRRLALQPQHMDSWHYLGVAYLALDKPEDAIDCFERILQFTHQHSQCYEHLATAYLKLDDKEKALTYFLRQLEIEPTANAFYNIGVLLIEKGRHRDAISYLKAAVDLDPMHWPAHLNLGVLFLKLQQREDALVHYQQAAKIKPNDPEIQHILMALTQNKTPEKAPAEYLKNLFDQYADYYDKHLTESLRYKVPQQLHAAIYDETKMDQASWIIVDLGCGTGLCGELFKEMAHKIIGIDISPEMVAVANKKNIYDELKVDDIETALAAYQNVDLVLAADVFTYVGDLNNIFGNVHNSLKSGGLFAFSVEKTENSPYELQPSIRYAHSRSYLHSLIQAHGYSIVRFNDIKLRMQKDVPVEGFLVILRKVL